MNETEAELGPPVGFQLPSNWNRAFAESLEQTNGYPGELRFDGWGKAPVFQALRDAREAKSITLPFCDR